MNNKKIGNEFETEFCELLKAKGYWVHFITPDKSGAQPFDIIAAKDGIAYAFDCKTSVKRVFPFSRLEENQKMSFELWKAKGNAEPYIAIKYEDGVYIVSYTLLKHKKKVDVEKDNDAVFRWK